MNLTDRHVMQLRVLQTVDDDPMKAGIWDGRLCEELVGFGLAERTGNSSFVYHITERGRSRLEDLDR